MSLFGSILEKLGVRKAKEVQPVPPPGAGSEIPLTPAEPAAPVETATPPAPEVQAIAVVDVVAKLEELAAANPQKLNWKTSIVDLLKLLGLDSSLEARRDLARELDAPADKFDDSASLNIWLHKTVLQKLADNGGNIPPELLD